jgi:hypothetical protein
MSDSPEVMICFTKTISYTWTGPASALPLAARKGALSGGEVDTDQIYANLCDADDDVMHRLTKGDRAEQTGESFELDSVDEA